MKLVPMLIILALFVGANVYVFYRLWHMLPPVAPVRVGFIVLAVSVYAAFFLSFFVRGAEVPFSLVAISYRIGTSWFFIFLYLLIIFLLADLLRVTHLLPVEKFLYHSWPGIGILTVFLTAIFTWGYIRYTHKERVELDITLTGKKESNRTLKIVALSDLHLGYGIRKHEFEKWIPLINKEQPDIVLLAGDVIDNSLKPLYEEDIAPLFSQIQSRYGIYGVPGNHEYISGIDKSLRFYQEAGIHALRDSVVLIDDLFYIAGRDDKTNPQRKELSEIVRSVDHTKPVILLDHQPYHLEEAEENRMDVQISGHTHRGQVLPITWITDLIYEKSHGYLQKGNSHIYVSSGMGIWGGKFHLGSQSEYVVINLKW
ncbi:MAG: metallophosphoesterase [Candidatus Azobacteroides sp.]|nr:metallophosphoesterase [Candidatus Azobacteroides sp.]